MTQWAYGHETVAIFVCGQLLRNAAHCAFVGYHTAAGCPVTAGLGTGIIIGYWGAGTNVIDATSPSALACFLDSNHHLHTAPSGPYSYYLWRPINRLVGFSS